VHVLDASRVVNVVSSLLSPEMKPAFLAEIGTKQVAQREDFAARRAKKPLLSLNLARSRRQVFDWKGVDIPRPEFLGTRVFKEVPLADIVPFIDWGPFFSAWELHGRFPDILKDPVVGTEATKLYNEAKVLLDRIVREKRFTANAVIGLLAVQCRGRRRRGVLRRVEVIGPHQVPYAAPAAGEAGRPVQPLPCRLYGPKESGRIDYIGGFAVTAGHGVDNVCRRSSGAPMTTTMPS
jgi:5-methyltetrahydrofolate--homocysteine methyltransferase